jgi:hypothetical protein
MLTPRMYIFHVVYNRCSFRLVTKPMVGEQWREKLSKFALHLGIKSLTWTNRIGPSNRYGREAGCGNVGGVVSTCNCWTTNRIRVQGMTCLVPKCTNFPLQDTRLQLNLMSSRIESYFEAPNKIVVGAVVFV